MKIVEFLKSGRQDITTEDVQSIEKPIMLFLGGLLNVHDIDTQGGFSGYLSKLRGNANAQILMPIDESPSNVPELTEYMREYCYGEKGPSQLSIDTYNAFFAPHIDQCDFSSKESIENLKTKLSNISLIGYSYGGNLVQQLAENMATHLSEKMEGTPNKGLKIFDICQSVKALNIGPVARYHQIFPDGTTELLDYNDPNYEGALTLFSQMSFLMQKDKIVQRTLSREPLGELLTSDIGIETRQTQSTCLYIDYVGRPEHKLIGYNDIDPHTRFAKIATNYDYLLHDMRTYMNIHEAAGNMVVFPTLAIAPILRDASTKMLEEGIDGKNWLSYMRSYTTNAQDRESIVKTYTAQDQEFRDTIEHFEDCLFDESLEFLERYVAQKVIELNPEAVTQEKPTLRNQFG